MDPNGRRPHVAVVGGGIAGLAAALRLHDAAPGTEVTLFEQGREVGGKLRTGEVGGVAVETGADAFLIRVPEAGALCARAGLGDELVHPGATGAAVAVDGGLRPLPAGTVLGIPADLAALTGSGLLSSAGLARVQAEPDLPGAPLGTDVSVGELVGRRLGPEVLDRLVEPLLGGVYAGHAAMLSLRATMPALAAELAGTPSLVRAAQRSRSTAEGPVFATVRGGMSRLAAGVAHVSGAAVRTGRPVRELRPAAEGWQLVVGSTRDAERVHADAVVLAVPAAPASRLLGDVSAAAAVEVAAIEYASVALVTLVLPGILALPAGTGVLVPAGAGRLVKAVTYVTRKWPQLAAPGVTVLRASVGRYGDEHVLQVSDDELVAAVRRDLDILLRPAGGLPAPTATAVTRWGGALPQYAVGHLDRVARARAALSGHPTLALAGAAYDGVGVPACVRSGQVAAAQVLAGLATVPVRGAAAP